MEALRPPRPPGPRDRQPAARRRRGDGRGRRALAGGRRRQRPGLRLLPRARLRGGRAGHRRRVARRRLAPQTAGRAAGGERRDEPVPQVRRRRPARPARRPRRGARRHRPGRHGRLLAGARDARVPAARGHRPGRPRRARPPRRRAAARDPRAQRPRRHDARGQGAPRQGRPRRARAAGPRHHAGRRRPRVPGAHARQPAVLDPGRGGRAVVVRLAVLGGARGLRGDQGPARPRAPRPALRRHEGGARGRHRGGPAGRPGDALRPQRPAGEARRRRRHGRGVP